MARPRVLPLPDEQARLIAEGVQAIERAWPGASNREFLRAFVPLVTKVTGEVFGAQTFQKLLRPLVPHRRPSSTTVQLEIAAYRARKKTIKDEHLATEACSNAWTKYLLLGALGPGQDVATTDVPGAPGELVAQQQAMVRQLADAESKLKAAELNIVAREQALRAANALIDDLRQQVDALNCRLRERRR